MWTDLVLGPSSRSLWWIQFASVLRCARSSLNKFMNTFEKYLNTLMNLPNTKNKIYFHFFYFHYFIVNKNRVEIYFPKLVFSGQKVIQGLL